MITQFPTLHTTNAVSNAFAADFSEIQDVEKRINNVLRSLTSDKDVRANMNFAQKRLTVKGATKAFDEWFATLLAAELHNALTEVREAVVKSAHAKGIGASVGSIQRRQYKGGRGGNVNILRSTKRLSNGKRAPKAPDGGRSGIHRERTISQRTKMHNELGDLDRAFILEALNAGSDVRTAMSSGPAGRHSKATYGNRGVAPKTGGKMFMSAGEQQMTRSSEEMARHIIDEVQKYFNTNV